jgi:hypothetical protein
MKYRFWDTEQKCWFKPTYQAPKGPLEELLVTQSGELCLRKLEESEVKFTHEGLFPERFIKSIYTGARDKEGAKIFQYDIIKDKDGKYHLIEYKNLRFKEPGTGYVMGYVIPEGAEKAGNKFEHPELLELIKNYQPKK